MTYRLPLSTLSFSLGLACTLFSFTTLGNNTPIILGSIAVLTWIGWFHFYASRGLVGLGWMIGTGLLFAADSQNYDTTLPMLHFAVLLMGFPLALIDLTRDTNQNWDGFFTAWLSEQTPLIRDMLDEAADVGGEPLDIIVYFTGRTFSGLPSFQLEIKTPSRALSHAPAQRLGDRLSLQAQLRPDARLMTHHYGFGKEILHYKEGSETAHGRLKRFTYQKARADQRATFEQKALLK